MEEDVVHGEKGRGAKVEEAGKRKSPERGDFQP